MEAKRRKISLVTLGCAKNAVDSERLAKQLEINGFEVIHDDAHSDAKIAIINTCGFINDAKKESINTILEFVHVKHQGKLDQIIVTGCLSERYKNELKKEIPDVDFYFGVESYMEILQSLGKNLRNDLINERILSTPDHYAYLKVSEGCDRTCSFCAIPLIRGKHKSKPLEEIINEASCLAERGVKELILIAQDLTYYGIDIYKKPILGKLLDQLAGIKGIGWIRLHYVFPANFPLDIIDTIKEHEKICRYIDIPFQHISDNMLSIMRRGINKKQTYDLISYLRKEIPDLALRTTLLTGHPCETKEDYEEMKEFVLSCEFDRLGIFTYSHEDETFSHKNYTDNISEKIKKQRAEEIMLLQQEISNKLNNKKIGKVFKVMVDRREGGYFIGRTESDSPEIDGEVLISTNQEMKTGRFCNVKITAANEFDLFGIPC